MQSPTDPEEVVREESAKLREHQEIVGKDPATGRPRGAEKRIAQLTREKMEARAEAEALRAQLYRQPQQQEQPQYQSPTQQQYQPRQYSPQEQQTLVEEYRQAQARLPEIEQDFASRHPDYMESVARLQPNGATPISPIA